MRKGKIALAEPYARARREDDYGQFTHVALKMQLPHVSLEMCGPPSMKFPVKPIGTQSESS